MGPGSDKTMLFNTSVGVETFRNAELAQTKRAFAHPGPLPQPLENGLLPVHMRIEIDAGDIERAFQDRHGLELSGRFGANYGRSVAAGHSCRSTKGSHQVLANRLIHHLVVTEMWTPFAKDGPLVGLPLYCH